MLLYLNAINRPTGPLFLKEGAFGLHWHAIHLVLAVKQVESQTFQSTFNPSMFCGEPLLTQDNHVLHVTEGLSIPTGTEGGNFESQGSLDAQFWFISIECALVFSTVSQTNEKLKKHL